MFEGEITWISSFIKSRSGGFCRIVVVKVLDSESKKPKVYLNPTHRNYSRWEPLLKEGTLVKNLFWKDEKEGLIHGDSPVEAV